MNLRDIKKDSQLIWKIFTDIFTPLVKQDGTYWKAHCFKCFNEWGLIINKTRGLFWCRSCHFGGDVINIVSYAYGCSAVGAIKIINEEYVDELEKISGGFSGPWR